MNYPIPRHLNKYFQITGDENDEFAVHGQIVCSCHNHCFSVSESNEKGIVTLTCTECRKEIILFDEGKHGWNGFICHDDYLDRTLPFENTFCPACRSDCFTIFVTVTSQGRNDFLEECVADDDSFTEDDWVDAFEWITVDLQCDKCRQTASGWMDCETM